MQVDFTLASSDKKALFASLLGLRVGLVGRTEQESITGGWHCYL